MIIHSKPSWFRALFTLQGSIIKGIAPRCIIIALLATVIVYIAIHNPDYFILVSITPFTLLGLSLSIFMSFRNNACYERWREGRHAWERIFREVRSFARVSIVIPDHDKRKEMLLELCGFCNALNARLREEDELIAAKKWISHIPDKYKYNISDGILLDIGRKCSDLALSHKIGELRYIALEQILQGLSEAQVVCERIKHTPLPFPYTLLLHRTIFMFCILLPFALAKPLGWLAPIFITVISYTFFGLDAISDELEDPFGRDPNDLPTDAMVRDIEREVLSILGYSDIPPVWEPKGCILS